MAQLAENKEMTAEEFKKYVCACALKDGDILFVDSSVIDSEWIDSPDWPETTPDVTFVFVTPAHGMPVADYIHQMPHAEALEILQSLAA